MYFGLGESEKVKGGPMGYLGNPRRRKKSMVNAENKLNKSWDYGRPGGTKKEKRLGIEGVW